MSIRLPPSRGALMSAVVPVAVEPGDVPQLAAGIGTVQSLHNVILRPQP